MTIMDAHSRGKDAFFDSLYKLHDPADDVDDEAEDEGVERSLNQKHRKSNRPTAAAAPTNRDHLSSLGHPKLQHRRTAPAASTPTVSFQERGSPRIPAPLRRFNTTSEIHTMAKRQRDEKAASVAADTNRKRSKVVKQAMQPIEKQIFKDLVFYFIKPDEIRQERKIRMAKAREYGAEVVFDFNERVTHIIVDKDLKYYDVLKQLDAIVLPSGIHVVNPQWAGECIRDGQLREPTEDWYQVSGCPEASQEYAAAGPSGFPSSPRSPSPASLQVQARPKPKPQPLETPKSTPPDPASPKNLEAVTPTKTPQKAETESQKDALDEIIEECLTGGGDMNLEELMSDESAESLGDSGTDISENESSTTKPAKVTKNKTGRRGTAVWQSHFQCMQKNDGIEGSQNPNSRTIQVLSEMMNLYDDMKDQWRTRSYRMAITSLKKTQDRHITTYEDAIKLPNVGERLAKKIVEIVTTDRLERLEYAKLEPTDQLLKLFHGIYGIGLVQAKKFVAAGYKTLEDVKNNVNLSDAQRIGVEHYEDFKLRIPRDEVTEHGKMVSETLTEMDDKIECFIMGSYRRGNKDCGDIDIIITKKNAVVEEMHDVLEKLVKRLFEKKFLMCGLALARHVDGTKWHGASRVGGPNSKMPWRRIDFLIVPGDELGAALLYFTGNDVFNRSMRLLASRKGMRLNQRGLYRDVMRGKDREKFNDGALLESKSEERIFEILGVPYRPPEHRIC